jgi:hypothetical protein
VREPPTGGLQLDLDGARRTRDLLERLVVGRSRAA